MRFALKQSYIYIYIYIYLDEKEKEKDFMNNEIIYCVKITVLFLEIIGLSPKSSFSQLMLQI
jgi:hypothetical protein